MVPREGRQASGGSVFVAFIEGLLEYLGTLADRLHRYQPNHAPTARAPPSTAPP
jgi:hypothetical protein